MAVNENRKLAHQMIDELKEEQLSEVIKTIRNTKNYHVEVRGVDDKGFTIAEPLEKEKEAIKKGRIEIENGDYYSHEDVFGDEDYV